MIFGTYARQNTNVEIPNSKQIQMTWLTVFYVRRLRRSAFLIPLPAIPLPCCCRCQRTRLWCSYIGVFSDLFSLHRKR